MILSMTGYGDASCENEGISYAVEIRSLNNRYYKANIKTPETMAFVEPLVDKLLRSQLGRGSLTFILKCKSSSEDAAYEINQAALQSYLRQLHAALGDKAAINPGELLLLPGVCQPRDNGSESLERHWSVIEPLVRRALERLIEMRFEEGRVLMEDLQKQCDQIKSSLGVIASRSSNVVGEYHDRLRERVNQLLAGVDVQLDDDDLRREVAIFAERCDISEEITRMQSHLVQFEKVCASEEHAGRKLEFIAQEMLREANTIGSKSNDSQIATETVQIKCAIDRIKEQAQNVE